VVSGRLAVIYGTSKSPGLMAIGPGRPDDPRFLVYRSVQPDVREVYVECEIPAPDATAGTPYDVAASASGGYADYEQTLEAVGSHLAR
jgi:hypothetical protein